MHQYYVFVGLLVITFLQSAVMGNGVNTPSECCFKFYGRKISVHKLDSYMETRMDCLKPGVIFVTKKGLRLCADPKLSWVRNVMKAVDDRDF
ncbi:C-C motif chemokine 13-like [Garra rufa]|uniref:C-C motif chemokine 13-like n=1 Tax=Garra rufa TaxID=137080 RepID=UPI003CCEA3E3